jgi:hypothetical protein
MTLQELSQNVESAICDITDKHELNEIKKELNFFIWLLYSVQSLAILTRFAYWRCCFQIFRYLTKNGYLKRENKTIDTEVLSNLFGVVMYSVEGNNEGDEVNG